MSRQWEKGKEEKQSLVLIKFYSQDIKIQKAWK